MRQDVHISPPYESWVVHPGTIVEEAEAAGGLEFFAVVKIAVGGGLDFQGCPARAESVIIVTFQNLARTVDNDPCTSQMIGNKVIRLVETAAVEMYNDKDDCKSFLSSR